MSVPPQESLVIRDFRPDDYESYARLLLPEGMFFDTGRDQQPRLEAAAKRAGSVLVAELAGELVGSIHIGDGNSFPLISGVVVGREHRGKQYGEVLMTRIEDELIKRGYTTAEILVNDDLQKQKLMDWYRRLGYRDEYSCIGMEHVIPNAVERRKVLVGAAIAEICDIQCQRHGTWLPFTDPQQLTLALERYPDPLLRHLQPLIAKRDPVRISPQIGHNNEFHSWTVIPLNNANFHLMQIDVEGPGDQRSPNQLRSTLGWYVGHDEVTNDTHVFGITAPEFVIEPANEAIREYMISSLFATESFLRVL